MGDASELGGQSSRPDAASVREALLRDGFARIPGVLDAAMVAAVDRAAHARLANTPPEHFAANRTTGSMLDIVGDPTFDALVAHPSVIDLLERLGFGHEIVFSAGYVISKPSQAPRLFWHQDWLYWDDPVSHVSTPHQLFAMYYLVDTTRANGCLRVIPGSHRRQLPAHEFLLRAHSPDALSGAELSHPTFGDLPGEIDVPVRAGDLLLGDSRLLHAAHANHGAERRTLITLWYHPAYEQLPAAIRASIQQLADQNGRALRCLAPALRAGHEPARESSEAAPLNREPRFPGIPGAVLPAGRA